MQTPTNSPQPTILKAIRMLSAVRLFIEMAIECLPKMSFGCSIHFQTQIT